MSLLNAERRWPLLFRYQQFEAYHRSGPNEYGWSNIVIRLLDAKAPKRSWHLSYCHAEQRLSERPYLEDLQRRHPEFMPQLLRRLKAWTPQP